MWLDIITSIYLLLLVIFCTALLGLIILYFGAEQYPVVKRSEKEKHFYNPHLCRNILFPSLKDEWTINISIIVPAYEEEKRLPPMLEECLEFLENRKNSNKQFTYEVIVVSDGSKDSTVKVALEYSKKFGSDKVRVLDLKPNRGKGGAVRMGVLSARGAVILFADADGATKFSDLSKLEDSLVQLIKCDYLKHPEIAAERDAVVCGSRSHLEDEALATRSMFRTFLMHGFHFLVWSFAVRSLKDTQCGFKLFTRKTARSLFSSIHVERWAFDVELLFLAESMNIPISEICVNWTEIDDSGSSVVEMSELKPEKQTKYPPEVNFSALNEYGIHLAPYEINSTYREDYRGSYVKRSDLIHQEQDFRDILAGPYIDPLLPDVLVEKVPDPKKYESCDSLYNKFTDKIPSLKKKALSKRVDQSKILEEYLSLDKSVYQLEFGKVKKIGPVPDQSKDIRKSLSKLPDDWIIPMSVYQTSFRNSTDLKNRNLLTFEMKSKAFKPRHTELGFTREEQKVLQTTTGETEYQEYFSNCGRDVIDHSFFGEVKPLPREFRPFLIKEEK